MGAPGTARFRIIVVLLLLLIIWQVYRLYPDAPLEGSADIKSELRVPEKIVQVEVYYEALCPDSRHFFIHHLQDTFPKMKDFMKLALIPYGKAKTIESPDGMLDFECQHGELECQANKVHACSIEYVQDINDQLQLVNCMIKDNMDPDLALTNCASALSIDTAQINDCAKSQKGAELLRDHGLSTQVVVPSFIPTILIDGSKDNQGSILKNFKSELCKHYKGYRTPDACM